jgi:hypothetical protein
MSDRPQETTAVATRAKLKLYQNIFNIWSQSPDFWMPMSRSRVVLCVTKVTYGSDPSILHTWQDRCMWSFLVSGAEYPKTCRFLSVTIISIISSAKGGPDIPWYDLSFSFLCFVTRWRSRQSITSCQKNLVMMIEFLVILNPCNGHYIFKCGYYCLVQKSRPCIFDLSVNGPFRFSHVAMTRLHLLKPTKEQDAQH